jgi:peptidoglycan/xylan/chitin deacetylase (PgdA/CDA1 family)
LRFVSPALRHILFPVLSRSGYLRRSAGAGPAVVTYHGVFPPGYKIINSALDGNLVHVSELRQQLELLKKRYHVISAQEFFRSSAGEESLPPHSILLTCDDGLRNTLTDMVPVLQELGLSCLFFVTGESAGDVPSLLWYEELYLMLLEATEPITLSLPEANVAVSAINVTTASNEKHMLWWDLAKKLSPFERHLRRELLNQIRHQIRLPENWRERFVQDPALAARFLMLDRAGLLQMTAAGMSIGAHTLSHPILARTSDALAWREISESRERLEEALGKSVEAFAYPFGDSATVTRRDMKLAEQAGFCCAFMNVGGGFGSRIDRFAIPRVHVTADMGLAEFEAHIAGFYRNLKRLLGGDELEVPIEG